MVLLIGLFALLSPFAAAQAFHSPTLDILQAEAENAPASSGSLEGVKTRASLIYTGERSRISGVAAHSQEDQGRNPSYHFKGTTPLQGITIYTPVEDKPGDDSTKAPKTKADWKLDWRVWAGASAAVTVGGIFFAPLLFLGGFLAGIAAVLWFVSSRAAK